MCGKRWQLLNNNNNKCVLILLLKHRTKHIISIHTEICLVFMHFNCIHCYRSLSVRSTIAIHTHIARTNASSLHFNHLNAFIVVFILIPFRTEWSWSRKTTKHIYERITEEKSVKKGVQKEIKRRKKNRQIEQNEWCYNSDHVFNKQTHLALVLFASFNEW